MNADEELLARVGEGIDESMRLLLAPLLELAELKQEIVEDPLGADCFFLSFLKMARDVQNGELNLGWEENDSPE
jgi:hypothetical protein